MALPNLLVALMLPYNSIMGAVVGLSKGKRESRRADSNRLPLLITSEIRPPLDKPNPAYLCGIASVWVRTSPY